MKKIILSTLGLALFFLAFIIPFQMQAQTNLALKKYATQSSNYSPNAGQASKAIDGNTSGNWKDGSVTHTKDGGTFNPWWQVDLGAVYELSEIQIWNRTDCCNDRLNNMKIYTKARKEEAYREYADFTYQHHSQKQLPISYRWKRKTARYVMIKLDNPNGILSLAEVKVLGSGIAKPTPKVKSLFFNNNSDWLVKYEVEYLKGGEKKKWNSGEIASGNNIRLDLYDDQTILSVKAEYKDLPIWKQFYNRYYSQKVKRVPTNHNAEGRLGSKPKVTVK